MQSHSQPQDRSKPFLKYAGGKQRLLAGLLPLLPPGGRLIEPFVGSGAVFLAAPYDRYIINDANSDLIGLWSALQCRPREYVERAQALFVQENLSRAAYLHIRAEFNASSDRFERAVRLPYLNRFGFNGLFRTNRSGEFNVPYGQPASVPGFPWDAMASAAQKLERTLIMSGGFKAALDMAGVCDVVYCDPPYLDSSTGASFTGYTGSGFTRGDHELLVEAAVTAVGRGAHVLISNHDTPETRELYRGWHIEELEVRRSISAKSAARSMVRELVALLPGPLAQSHT